MGKVSEAMKIVKGNLGNLGESILVDSGKLKTCFATDLLLVELKRFSTLLKQTQGRRAGKDFWHGW